MKKINNFKSCMKNIESQESVTTKYCIDIEQHYKYSVLIVDANRNTSSVLLYSCVIRK